MERRFSPDAWLCACAGAFVGAFASLMIPAITMPGPIALLSPSLFSLTDTTLDPAVWADNMRTLLRAAIGPAVHTVTLRSGDTLGDVLVKTGADRETAQSVV